VAVAEEIRSNVFLGLSLEKQGRYSDAESAYNVALKTKDNDTLAWQGLVGLYERQGDQKISEYGRVARRLGELWIQA
jgi:superkiller protein 3